MQIIKVKFLKDGNPAGRAYTYYSPVSVSVGDVVQINSTAIGYVVEINVPEEEIETYRDKIKTIAGLPEKKTGRYTPEVKERFFNILRGVTVSSHLAMNEKTDVARFINYLEDIVANA